MSDPSDDEVDRRIAALHGRPPHERVETLLALGRSRAGAPVPAVLAFLEDPEPMVRIAAAQTRWQTAADPSELDRLVGVAADELTGDDAEMALMAGTALVSMGEAAVPPLIRRFAERDGGGHPLLVRVIGEIAGEEAMRFLNEAAESDEPVIANEAREALAAIAEEEDWEDEPG